MPPNSVCDETCCYFCDKLLIGKSKKPYHARCNFINNKLEKLAAKKSELSHQITSLEYESFLISKSN